MPMLVLLRPFFSTCATSSHSTSVVQDDGRGVGRSSTSRAAILMYRGDLRGDRSTTTASQMILSQPPPVGGPVLDVIMISTSGKSTGNASHNRPELFKTVQMKVRRPPNADGSTPPTEKEDILHQDWEISPAQNAYIYFSGQGHIFSMFLCSFS